MAGPWEKYASQPSDGPWTKYQGATAAPAEPPSMLGDVAKAGGSGLVEGLHGVVGMAGDFDNFLRHTGNWIGNKVRGLEGRPPAPPSPRLTEGILPTTPQVMEATGFEPYEAQTRAGKFAGTVGRYLPAAASFGAGAGIKGALSSATAFGVVPSIAEEAAGTVTEGTGLEPYARIAAAVLSGGVAGGVRSLGAKGKALETAPSTVELKQAANQQYDAFRRAGGTLHPDSYDRFLRNLAITLRNSKLTPVRHAKSLDVVKVLADMRGKPIDLQDLDIMRSATGQIVRSADDAERFAASLIRDKIDDFMLGLRGRDIVAGDKNAALNALLKARGYVVRQKKGEALERVFADADLSGANYTQAGIETAIRQGFRRILKNPKQARQFTSAERDEMRRIVTGGPIRNLARFVGKFAPRGPVTGYGMAAAHSVGGPAVSVPLGIAAETAKAAASSGTRRHAETLSAIIRSGGNLPPAATASTPLAMISGAAKAAAPNLSKIPEPPLEITVPIRHRIPIRQAQ